MTENIAIITGQGLSTALQPCAETLACEDGDFASTCEAL